MRQRTPRPAQSPSDAALGVPDRPPRRTQRWKRPNVWLGGFIPLILLVFAVEAYKLVLFDVFPFLRSRDTMAAIAYIAWVHITLGLVAYSYFVVYFQPLSPPVNKEPPMEVQQKRVVFACDERGEPTRCFQDRCGGAWQSVRTRHCRDCGTCRAGFDHHCPFLSNCVTTSKTFKPFACFLGYAVLLLGVAFVPLAPLQLRAFKEVVATTWDTDWMRQCWWSRWYSWAGGPVWRYAGALVIGYLKYSDVSADRPFLVPDSRTPTFQQGGVTYAYNEPLYPSLAVPRLRTLMIVSAATFISLIGVAMIILIVLNARKGLSAVQVERTRRWRIQQRLGHTTYDARLRLWVPLTAKLGGTEPPGAIVLVNPDVPLFDLGPSENWKALMGDRWWKWFAPTTESRVSDFDVNPTILAGLQAEARKRV
ncbi:hypothetical protein JCM1841_003083 [Sporobolomyces salmonicolor]